MNILKKIEKLEKSISKYIYKLLKLPKSVKQFVEIYYSTYKIETHIYYNGKYIGKVGIADKSIDYSTIELIEKIIKNYKKLCFRISIIKLKGVIMESEKVKEIKKELEERTQHKPINCSHSEYVEACGMYCRYHREFVADMGIKNGQTCENCNKFTATDKGIKYADILTLINELESENERLSKELDSEWKDRRKAEEDLHKAQWNYKIGLGQSKSVNKKLKDRIAELETENAKLLDSVETVQNNRCTTKCELTKKQLKHFAERLKEKLEEYRLENEYFIKDEPNGNLWQLNASVFCIEVTQDGGLVDETLKEFLK